MGEKLAEQGNAFARSNLVLIYEKHIDDIKKDFNQVVGKLCSAR